MNKNDIFYIITQTGVREEQSQELQGYFDSIPITHHLHWRCITYLNHVFIRAAIKKRVQVMNGDSPTNLK